MNQEENEDVRRVSKALVDMQSYLNGSSKYGEELSINQESIIRSLSSLNHLAAATSTDAPVSPPSPDPLSQNFDLLTYIKSKNELKQAHGLKFSPVTVTYDNLQVFGDRISKQYIRTFGSSILNMLSLGAYSNNGLFTKKNVENRELIHPTSGFFKPGEMTLVLGRPGAGCSTFLREVAGVSRGLAEIRGDTRYNGISQAEFREKYPSFVTYNPEDDAHYPMLTVRETLRFALECKIGTGVHGQTREQVISEKLEVILRVLGLVKCADTMVGDETVRGCSGGERKRVSIAEQWCIGASVGVWDGSTKGLDSSTALDFIRALRVMTDLSKTSQIVSIYQASEEIFALFDKVIVISEGHVVYFGPAKEARPFFEKQGLEFHPRNTTPDYLTGLLDKDERIVIDGFNPPLDPREMENLYLSSDVKKQMDIEFHEIVTLQKETNAPARFHQDVAEIKTLMGMGHLLDSPYGTTWMQQFGNACKREITLAKRDLATAAILVFDTIMSIIVGGLFLQLENSPAGAFGRGGVLFFALVYMCFNCLASVPLIIKGRAISGKHKSFNLYRTELQVLSTQLTNAPAILLLTIAYSVCNYWMAGLYASAGSFFTFMLLLFLTNQAFGSIVRLVATIMPDLNTALMANSAYLLLATMSMGYIIPYQTMHRWFKWVFWINPLQYGLRGLFQNEFNNIVIPCGSTVPYAVGSASDSLYSSLGSEYKACSITGAKVGDVAVRGQDYLDAYMGFDMYNLYWNVLILIAYISASYIGMMMVSKYFGATPAGYSVNVWRREIPEFLMSDHHKKIVALGVININKAIENDSDTAAANSEDHTARNNSSTETGDAKFTPAVGSSFSWKHVNYSVVIPKTGEKRQLLVDVQGMVQSSEMVALMGSSGAGKTTLLDCLTQRKTSGDLNGQIYLGVNPQGRDFKALTAYCEQMDVHNPFSTVRETVRFAAVLRQPESISIEEKEAFADHIIDLLELNNIADAMVGRKFSREGISLEEQKRLTIACELASKPDVLFLDEPTSGLDSQAAYTIVRLLRKLADRGQAILCTIHQPSALVFEHFNKVLLLARGGQTVYFGDLGQDCSAMIQYFIGNGADKCPKGANPAEWMLNVIGAGIGNGAVKRDPFTGEIMSTEYWVKKWKEGSLSAGVTLSVDKTRGVEDNAAISINGVGQQTPDFNCSFFTQLKVTFERMVKSYWRNPEYNIGRVGVQVWTGLWLGFAFFDSSFTMIGVEGKTFSLFMILTIGALQSSLSQPNFHEMRNVFIRERSTGVYHWLCFAIAVILNEIPYILFSSTVFFCCYYLPIGFDLSASRAGYFWLLYNLYCMSCVSWGQAIMSILPAVQHASAVNPFFKAMQLLVAGVAVPFPQLGRFFEWIYWINPFHYFTEGVLANEIGHRVLTCDSKFGHPFFAPSGMTCGQYMADFFAAGDQGTLHDASATDLCYYCPFGSGDAMLDEHYGNWSYGHRWRNFGIFFGFYAFNILIIFVMVKLYKVDR